MGLQIQKTFWISLDFYQNLWILFTPHIHPALRDDIILILSIAPM